MTASDRSDHLIERAAALLRSGNANADPGSAGAGSAPSNGPASGGPLPLPGRGAPIVGRPTNGAVSAEDGRRGRQGLVLGGSVADLRARSDVQPITIAALERAGLMVARGGRTRTNEEYRIVMGRVLRALHEDEEGLPLQASGGAANVVLVTSARPGEGKSFTALNLSGSIARNAGDSVLLVDVDAKKNSLTDYLGLSDRPGFLDLVANRAAAVEEWIVPTELPQLSILPLGQRPTFGENALTDPNLESRWLTPPITRLAERFPRSLIVLDAPPCLSTSDPHTLAPAVGQVVMVVEAERTQKSELEAAVDLVRVCPNITMLLNKVKASSGHAFGSYDYFGNYT